MRLSVIPFKTIMDALNLNSSMFVIPIFSTALLSTLNDDVTYHKGQHVVDCYEVQRYVYVILYINAYGHVYTMTY